MPSNHLILCHPLLLLPSIFPSIRVFSSESVLCIRWPEYWSFSFNISPSNEHPGLISFRMDWLDPLNRGLGDYLCIILIVHNQGILFLKIKLSLAQKPSLACRLPQWHLWRSAKPLCSMVWLWIRRRKMCWELRQWGVVSQQSEQKALMGFYRLFFILS